MNATSIPEDLVLVRHGQSEQNALLEAVRQGMDITDAFTWRPPAKWRLTERGCQQAKITGRWLQEAFPAGFGTFFTSTMLRAEETAGRLQLPGAAWRRSPLLCERSEEPFTRLEGETSETFARRFQAIQQWRDLDRFHWAPDAGEPMISVVNRAQGFLTQARHGGEAPIVAVTHGGFMRCLRLLLVGGSSDEFVRMEQSTDPADEVANCEVWHLSRRPGGSGGHDDRIWFRRSRPTEGDDGTWAPLDIRTATDDELLADAERWPPLDLGKYTDV
jgi:broad specificity phosphatase PhoE